MTSLPWGRAWLCRLWLIATAMMTAACTLPASLAGSPPAAVAGIVTDGAYTLFQEPQAGYRPVVDMISHARSSVSMTMYELADDAVEQALLEAQRRGATVTVVFDAAWHGRRTNQPAYDRLKDAGINVVWAPSGTIAHEKAVATDDSTAIVSTANLTSRYYGTGRDAMIETTDPADVAAIATTIGNDAAAAGTGQLSRAVAAPHLVWSPASREAFIETISAARSTLDITSEEFKDRPVQIAVAHAAQRGVTCRLVLNSDAATSAAVSAVEHAGCVVHVLPRSTKGLYMHEKVIIVDAQIPGRAAVLIGSQNISTRSLTENRELSIKLDSTTAPNIVAACATQFSADYNSTN